MVRDFAGSVEREFFFSLLAFFCRRLDSGFCASVQYFCFSFSFHVLADTKLTGGLGTELKEMQNLYHALVAQVQAIFDTHIQAHAHTTCAVSSLPLPSPLSRTSTNDTTSPGFFANLSSKTHPKTRARLNTNPTPGQSSTSTSTSTSNVNSTTGSAAASQQDVTTAQLAYKELAALFYTINARYRISWECAEAAH